jgi:hypothetical protein
VKKENENFFSIIQKVKKKKKNIFTTFFNLSFSRQKEETKRPSLKAKEEKRK